MPALRESEEDILHLKTTQKLQSSTYMTLVFFCGAATFVACLCGGGAAHKAGNGTRFIIENTNRSYIKTPPQGEKDSTTTSSQKKISIYKNGVHYRSIYRQTEELIYL